MRKHWTELILVFVVLWMLQDHVFIGRAFGEARIQEETRNSETVVMEETETLDLSTAPGQEMMTPEKTDGAMR